MSAADSGVIILAAPVIVTVGAVSLAAAGISAAAEKYKRFRYDKAYAEELMKQSELDFARKLADENREEYEAILAARADEENARRSRESQVQDAAEKQLRDELFRKMQLQREIHAKLEHMDTLVRQFEEEFGENAELRKMAEIVHNSETMFGDVSQLLQELDDLLFIIIPGMTEEKREERHARQLQKHIDTIAVEHMHIKDSSEEFVSLNHAAKAASASEVRSPWDRFVERVRAVAAVEEAYFETEAHEMLEEMESLPEGRQNFYLLQHQEQLCRMEEQAEEYRSSQTQLTEEVMDAFCMYLAIVKKLGIEAKFSEEDLSDAYILEDMRSETQHLVEEYKRARERQYTVNSITKVMERHHMHFEDMTINEHGALEMEYTMDEQSGIRITRSESGAFEMQFQGRSSAASASLDEKRRITEKARHFCSILPEITEELEEEYGITFEQTALQPPIEENIEIRQSKNAKRVEKAKTLKTMKMN